MPNHVTTRCTVTGPSDELARFRAACIREVDGETCLDFNAVIPMPESVKGTQAGSDASLGFEILTGKPKPTILGGDSALKYPWVQELGITTVEQLRAWAEKERPNALIEGQKAIDAHKETGFYDWYDWCNAKWGTKWNSYSFRLVDDEPERMQFLFDTAWSFPRPVFEALAEAYPNLVFECKCFDEGWNFAASGCFNAEPPFFNHETTDELYEAVYGNPPQHEDEDEDASA